MEDDAWDDRITELPLAVHEMRPTEASGQYSPVINPNRTFVSGATLQRGLLARNRVIPPLFTRADGVVVTADFALSGYTFLQGDDLSMIDYNTASLNLVQSPNETAVAEIFDFSFWRHFLSYGLNGIRDTNVDPSDFDFPAERAIYGGNDWVQSIPNSLNGDGDDFQTDSIATVCGSTPDRPWRTLTADEILDSYQNVFLHEVSHGIDIEHDEIVCSNSIMSIEGAVPVVRTLTDGDRAQIRIHRKH